jgi:hypothetical protein
MCAYTGVFGSGLGGEDRRFGIKRKKMMDGCIGRDRRSLSGIWVVGQYVPGGVGFVDQLRVRLDELLRLVHVAVRGSFPDVVHGLLLGLAGLSSHDDDFLAQFFGTSRLGGRSGDA